MKPTLKLFVLAAALAASLGSVASAKQAVIGQQAPDFTLTSIDGQSYTLSELKGKTVVLEWVNQECPFVMKHYQKTSNMPKLQQAATADGVVWLTINSGKPGAQGDFDPIKVKEWMRETGAAPTAYFRDQSGTVGRSYGAKTTPHMYVITPDGTLVYDGAIDSIRSSKPEDIGRAENYVTAALASVKAGQPVAKSSSEPYGCSVKY